MPSPPSKPAPANAPADEKPLDGIPAQWVDIIQKLDAHSRRVDEVIRARERQAAAPVVNPVLPVWSTQLKRSMAAVTEAATAARVSRPPRQHSPDGVAGGDEKRMAALEALVFAMEVEGEDIEHELRQVAGLMVWWEKQAMSAVEAGNDDLARQALALRRECQISLAPLLREAKLSRRICGEYRALLDELRRSR